MSEDFILNNIKTVATTIGTQTLTIKFLEHDGKMEEANQLREQNQRLEDQMERMIALYRARNPVEA